MGQEIDMRMIEVKVSDLEGAALDWAVAEIDFEGDDAELVKEKGE